MIADSRTHIATLRARGYPDDGPATRLALARLLGSADLQPRAMPPAAILIVRRLADPLPGRVAPSGAARVSVAWEAAGRAALAELHGRAARPHQGPVPPTAQAVVFADAAELLAGLALDLSQAEALTRWWWRAILARLPQAPAEALATALCRQPEAIPAVFQHLERRGRATQVARFLSPAQAGTVLAALRAAYRLPDDPTLPATRSPAAESLSPEVTPDDGTTTAFPAAPGTPPVPVTPWQAWWPQTPDTAALPAASACLLGLALGLIYAPAQVRSVDFQAQVARWRAAPRSRTDTPGSSNPAGLPIAGSNELPQTEAAAPADLAGGARLRASVVEPVAGAGENARSAGLPADDDLSVKKPDLRDPKHKRITWGLPVPSREAGAVEDASPRPARPAALSAASSGPGQSGPGRELSAAPDPTSAGPAVIPTVPAGDSLLPDTKRAEVPAEDPAPSFQGGVETALGGVLFLINMLARLDLPACLGASWALGPEVGPWGVLDAVARGLLDLAPGVFVEDPLWAVLAELDAPAASRGFHSDAFPERRQGRHTERSEGSARRRRAYRLPKTWPLLSGPVQEGGTSGHPQRSEGSAPQTDEQAFAWAQRRNRLRLWSAAGYLLADVPHPVGDGESAARTLLQDYGADAAAPLQALPWNAAPLAALHGPLAAGLSAATQQWLRPLLPYLRRRLLAALDPAGREGLTVQETLLMQRGRLFVTATHVDLMMNLGEVSLPVRLAGLDTNPGWMPDFGRVVLFHYD